MKRDPAFPFLSLDWGAQAASLQLPAACRTIRLAQASRDCREDCFGKLPKLAGWQPALPRIAIFHLPFTIVPSGSDLCGGIAQMVERQLCKLEVRGSNPLASGLRLQRHGGRSCRAVALAKAVLFDLSANAPSYDSASQALVPLIRAVADERDVSAIPFGKTASVPLQQQITAVPLLDPATAGAKC